MPATLAVVALAAFLAFGLMATNGAQPAAAQAKPCATVMPGSGPDGLPKTDNTNADKAEGCDSSSTAAVIELEGRALTGATDVVNYVVYGTGIGGAATQVYPPRTIYGNHDTDDNTADIFYASDNIEAGEVEPLSAIAIQVGPGTVNIAGQNVASKETFTVSGTPASIATVYVVQGTGFAMQIGEVATTPKTNGENSLALNTGARALALDIIFLGPPVATSADSEENDDADENPEPQSVLTIDTEGGPNVSTDATITLSDTSVVVLATVRDNSSRDLTGSISYAVTFAEGSDLKGGQASYTTRGMDYPGETDAGKTHSISGWNTGADAGPVKVNVSATFTDANGASITLPLVSVTVENDTIEEISVSRAGAAKTIKSAVFGMGCLKDQKADGTANEPATPDVYTDDRFVMANNKDCKMVNRFGAGEVVVIKAHLEDTLGSIRSSGVSIDLKGATKLASTHVPTSTHVWVYTVKVEDPMLGPMNVMVSTSSKDVSTIPVSFAVAGPPTQYMFVDPVDNIELGGRATFTVQAYDANDGVPHFAKNDEDMYTDDKVDVVVPDIAESLVRGRMLDNGILTLDSDTGMGTFIIYAPSNAPVGSTARIFVSAGDVEITHTVMFGMTMEAADTDTSLQAIPNSSISVTNNADSSITVNWMGGDNADRFIVVAAELGSDPFTYELENVADGAARMATISGLNSSSSYIIIVIALQGTNFQYGVLQSVTAN